MKDLNDRNHYVVHGTLLGVAGRKIEVRAYDRDLRSQQLLGEMLVDDQGRYRIEYDPSQFRRADKGRADLLICAYDTSTRPSVELARSPIFFNAEQDQVVDLVLPVPRSRQQPSELMALARAVQPLLDDPELGVEGKRSLLNLLAALRQDSQHQDHAFIAAETGFPREAVNAIARAAQWTLQIALAGLNTSLGVFASLYGLQRLELIANLPGLAALPGERIARGLRTAVRRNLIPPLNKIRMQEVLSTFQAFTLHQALDLPSVEDGLSLRALLKRSPLPDEVLQDDFAQRLMAHKGNSTTFWDGLHSDEQYKEYAAGLRTTLQLGVLAQGDIALTDTLLRRQAAGEFTSAEELAGRDENWWLALIKEAGSVPSGVPGTKKKERTAAFARATVTALGLMYPTRAFAREFVGDKKTTGQLHANRDLLLKFFKQHPTYDLRGEPVYRFVEKQRSGTLRDLDDETIQSLTEHLAQIQRMFKLAPSYVETHALLAEGFTSAHAIIQLDQRAFVQRVMPMMGMFGAVAVYERSQVTAFAAANFVAMNAPALNQTQLAVLPSADVAEWREIFGSFNLCKCEHCRSLHSPAAYLADTLAFLAARSSRRQQGGRVISVLDILLERRPDLAELELMCDNTNLAIPYLDLVNELLENRIAPIRPIKMNSTQVSQLDSGQIPLVLRQHLLRWGVVFSDQASVSVQEDDVIWTVRDEGLRISIRRERLGAQLTQLFSLSVVPQSVGDVTELAAYPRYRNHEAYRQLDGEASFPWQMPFNLWLEEVRAFLSGLGVPRHELMAALKSDHFASWRDPDIARETLGLNVQQAALITGGHPGDPWQHWGLLEQGNQESDPLDPARSVQGNWIEMLSHTSLLMSRTGLSYEELVDLLDLDFINPHDAAGQRQLVLSDPGNCEPSATMVNGLDDVALDRIHRFVRLQRALHWRAADLDRAIRIFSAGAIPEITPQVLVQIAQIVRLLVEIDVSVETVLTWWHFLETRNFVDAHTPGWPLIPSQYERIFQSRATADKSSERFALNHDRLELGNPSRNISEFSAEVASALGIGTDTLVRLLSAHIPMAGNADRGEPLLDGRMNLANLSKLYRVVTLAGALELSINELLSAWAVIGDPFMPPNNSPVDFYAPEATLRFVDAVKFVRSEQKSPVELEQLLCHRPSFGPALEDVERRSVERLLAEVGVDLAQVNGEDDPVLRSRAMEDVIVARLQDALGMDGATLRRALGHLLPSWDGNQYAMQDLQGGLKAEYFPNRDLQGAPAVRRMDRQINFRWGTGKADPALPEDNFSVRWEGLFRSEQSGKYTFHTRTDDGVRLKINGQVLIDQWVDQAETTHTADVELEFGKLYLLTMEYFDSGFDAIAQLLWTPPGATQPSLLPNDRIFPTSVIDTLLILKRFVQVVQSLHFSKEELLYLLTNGHAIGWLTPMDLPASEVAGAGERFHRWRRIVELARLRKKTSGQPGMLLDIWSLAETLSADLDGLWSAISTRTGWNLDDLKSISAHWGLGAQHLRHEQVLSRISGLLNILARLRISIQDALKLAQSDQGLGSDEARRARQAIRSRYGDDWLKALQPIMDKLRERTRDALVAHLVARERLKSPDHLSDALLVDVQMSACQTTTRIAQAINTVQLFVQRCQLNLEPGVAADSEQDGKWLQWKWMKQYRVWEANRKVFLYPENWIEPDLRDDKSPLFQELESELMQQDLTSEGAEAALERYVEKLETIAQLQVSAICEQSSKSAGCKTLHLVMRTMNAPHTYYHRLRLPDNTWTSLEKIDLDIEGDHLTLVLHNDRPMLLWPVINEKTITPKLSKDGTTAVNQQNQADSQPAVWQVQLAWSEYRRGAWSPKKLSGRSLEVPLTSVKDGETIRQDRDRSSLYFRVVESGGQLTISCCSRPALTVAPDQPEVDHKKRIAAAKEAASVGYDTVLDIWAQIPFLSNMTGAVFEAFLVQAAPTNSGREEIANFANKAALFSLYAAIVANEATLITAGTVAGFILAPISVILAPLAGGVVGGILGAEIFKAADGIDTINAVAGRLKDLSDRYVDGIVIEESDSAKELDELNAALLANADADEQIGDWDLGDGTATYAARELTPIPGLARAAVDMAVKILAAVEPLPAPPVPESDSDWKWGEFRLDECQSAIVVQSSVEKFSEIRPPRTIPMFNQLKEFGSGNSFQIAFQVATEITEVLQQTPGDFTLTFSPEAIGFTAQRSFVYQDPRHAYLVSLVPGQGSFADTISSLALLPDNGLVAHLATQSITHMGIEILDLGLFSPGKAAPREPIFHFESLQHSEACRFLRMVNREGLTGLLSLETQGALHQLQDVPHQLLGPAINLLGQPVPTHPFAKRYYPTWQETSAYPYPRDGVAFAQENAYASYNWELFFHAPFLIATQLTRNQRFEEAQHWFHFIFDPTESSGHSPQRFWKVLPFHVRSMPEYLAERARSLIARLASGEPDPELRYQLATWRAKPFNPHALARLRTSAFQKAVVMKYLDNLIAWGDHLFQLGTQEALTEAAQLYKLAAYILGERPNPITPAETSVPETFNSLTPRLGSLSNMMISVENLMVVGDQNCKGDDREPDISLPALLYFCAPENDKLQEYWTIVADRLFKIRYCKDLDGNTRQNPPFASPIDPGLLVRAVAAGLDISDVQTGAALPLHHYRFGYLIQKATELAGETRALGGALLAALEKRDAEELSRLRAGHERVLLEAMRQNKIQQIDEARAGREALELSRRTVQARFDFYDKIQFLNPQETAHLQLLGQSLVLQSVQTGLDFTGNLVALAPNLKVGFPFTIGATFGGDNLAQAIRAFSAYLGGLNAILGTTASMTATLGGYLRRADDWRLQRELAQRELAQLDRQIVAAQIREAIVAAELINHDRQIANSLEIETHLHGKFTNVELYGWMVDKLTGTYLRAYKSAFELARQAELAFRYELGVSDNSARIIQFGYWDNLHRGLLAGDRLVADMKQLDVAYLNHNIRELEITKHISLRQIDPLALIMLRATGACKIKLSEELFDFDCPGHYMRRIKSVAITIPCVTGPYTGVNCTLRLNTSRVRTSKLAENPTYEENWMPATRSIVTSSAQNDSGVFELNLRDERYLPFEGAGAISNWTLELPAELRQFDYDTISDVVLHLRYTALEGDNSLREAAVSHIQQLIDTAQAPGSVRFFSVRHEFPIEWAKFQSQIPGVNQRYELRLNLQPEHYPLWSKGKAKKVVRMDVFAQSIKALDLNEIDIAANADMTNAAVIPDKLIKDVNMGNLFIGRFERIPLPAPEGDLKFYIDDNSLENLWIGLAWGAA